jgi:hypothetical protein
VQLRLVFLGGFLRSGGGSDAFLGLKFSLHCCQLSTQLLVRFLLGFQLFPHLGKAVFYPIDLFLLYPFLFMLQLMFLYVRDLAVMFLLFGQNVFKRAGNG